MRIYYLAIAAFILWSDTAYSKGNKEAASLATCAWTNVSDTAFMLIQIKPKRMRVYDSIGSERAAPFMRVYAACESEWKALKKLTRSSETSYKFLKQLRKVKPKTVAPDRFATTVYRCIARFRGLAVDTPPAGIWWSYGDDPFEGRMAAKYKLFNNQIEITASDIAAIEKRGDGASNLATLLTKAENQEVVEVETYEMGIEGKSAFRIKPTKANSKCQIISSNGELSDA